MAVENDFLPFAVGGSANVLTQAQYAALTSLLQNGFQSGIANSQQLNKVWRQSSIMAAVLAQFIAQRTGQNVIDDGTTTTILANLLESAAALNGDSTQVFSVAPATATQHALQLGQATGRLLRRSVYYLNGATQTLSINDAAGTTTGATTFTPLALTNNVKVRISGGGGGGGSTGFSGATAAAAGAGGGAGGYCEAWLTLAQIGSSVAITVGAGGTGPAGSAATQGGTGGTSSFGTLVSCTGGVGGNGMAQTGAFPAQNAGATGGAVSLGTGVTAQVSGKGGGGASCLATSYNNVVSGQGGASGFGFGGGSNVTATGSGGINNGNPGVNGSGGSGGVGFNSASSGGSGGAGGPGLIVVEEYA